MSEDNAPRPGTPCSRAEAVSLIERALRAFRPIERVVTNVPTACMAAGEQVGRITDVFSESDSVFLYFETSEEVYVTTAGACQHYLEALAPWEEYNFLVVAPDCSLAAAHAYYGDLKRIVAVERTKAPSSG